MTAGASAGVPLVEAPFGSPAGGSSHLGSQGAVGHESVNRLSKCFCVSRRNKNALHTVPGFFHDLSRYG
jgi:hypothetical protein